MNFSRALAEDFLPREVHSLSSIFRMMFAGLAVGQQSQILGFPLPSSTDSFDGSRSGFPHMNNNMLKGLSASGKLIACSRGQTFHQILHSKARKKKSLGPREGLLLKLALKTEKLSFFIRCPRKSLPLLAHPRAPYLQLLSFEAAIRPRLGGS